MSQAGSELALAPRPGISPQATLMFGATLIFSTLSLLCAALSDGFVTADACTHYLYAKYAFSDPVNLVDLWARPFCTALYAVPAHLGGRFAVRVTSLLVALGCAFVAFAIARRQGMRWPVLALLFTLAQPLLFVYSFSEMTELPFALLLGAAFLAYQDRRWFWAALLAGLTPTARPEGFAIVMLAAAALMLHRRWLALPVLALPLLAWDLGGWWITGRVSPWWRWLPDAWPWSAQSLYGRGNILTFVAVLPLIVSPLILPAMLLGMWQSFRDAVPSRLRRGSTTRVRFVSQSSVHSKLGQVFFSAAEREPQTASAADRHLRLCRFLIAAIPLAVLVGHSLLRWLGKMGSYGEPRYLLVVAPFWALLSARGWEWMFERLRWTHPLRWAAAAALAPILVNVFYPAVPIHLSDDWKIARRFADWYDASPLRRQYPNVVSSHPGVFYFLDQDPSGVARRGGFTRGVIQSPPPGTLLIWDPTLSAQNANADGATTLIAIYRAGWIRVPQLDDLLNGQNRSQATWGSTTAPSDPASSWHVFRSPAPLWNPQRNPRWNPRPASHS